MRGAVGKGTIVVYVEQVVNAICSFIISILLARFLTATDFGLWKLLASVTILVTYSSSFGIEVTLIRYVPQFLIKKQQDNIRRLIAGSVGIRLIFLIIFFVLVFLYRDTIDNIFKTGVLFQDLIIPTVGYLTLYHINTIVGRAILTAYSKRYLLGYIKILSKLISLLAIYLVTVYEMGFKEIVYALLLIQVLELFLYVPLSGREVFKNNSPETLQNNSEAFPLRRIFYFALPSYFFLSGQVFREYTIDNFVISHYMTLEDVAYYGVAIAFPSYFRNFSPGRMLHGILLPEFVKQYTIDQSKEKLRFGFTFLQKINSALLWPAYVLFIFLAEEIVTMLYGENYIYSVFPAQLLLIFSVVQTLSDPFYLVCNTLEKSNIIFQTTIWGLVNLVGNIILVPIYGIVGAAIATGVSSLFIYMHFYLILKKTVKLSLDVPLYSFAKAIVSLLPLVISLLAYEFTEMNTYLFISLLFISILIYMVLIILTGFFSKREFEFFNRSMQVKNDQWIKRFQKFAD